MGEGVNVKESMMEGCAKSSGPSVAVSLSHWTCLAFRNWLNKNCVFMRKRTSPKIGLLNRQWVWKRCILGLGQQDPWCHQLIWHEDIACQRSPAARYISLSASMRVVIPVFHLPKQDWGCCCCLVVEKSAPWMVVVGGKAIGHFWFWWPGQFCGGLWITQLILAGDVWGGEKWTELKYFYFFFFLMFP